MQRLIKTSLLCLGLVSTTAIAQYTDDTVNINKVFVNDKGAFAIQSTTPIQNASAARDCGNGKVWAKQWAGVDATASERLVSLLQEAYVQGKSVDIRTEGCTGDWFKITAAYMNP